MANAVIVTALVPCRWLGRAPSVPARLVFFNAGQPLNDGPAKAGPHTFHLVQRA